MYSTNALIMCGKMEMKKNARESIPKTDMPDLSKTYGNLKKKFQRANAAQEKVNKLYLNRIRMQSIVCSL